jgi:hypothetical protein
VRKDEKTIKKLIKLRKLDKNNKKLIKILKNRPVWFRFYKPEIEKTKSKPEKTRKNRVKLEKIESNWFESVFILKIESKPISLNQFYFGVSLKKKN